MAKKKQSNRFLYILLAIVGVGIVGALLAKSAGLIGQPPETEVETAEVSSYTIIEKVNASGMIQPEKEVKISPDVPGEIINLLVVEGDSVVQGQLLLKIRPDNYQSILARQQATLNQQIANLASSRSRLAQSEAQYLQNSRDFERNEKLHKQNVISDAEFDQFNANFHVAKEELEAARQGVEAAKFMVESARASVSEAQEQLRLTSIYAPVDGTVSKLDVEQGERVVGTSQMAGTEMLRIADLKRMEVRVDVNENDIIRVNKGDTAIIDVDSYTYMKRKFKGVVTSVAHTANTKSSPDAVTEFEVKIRILNSSYEDLIKEKIMRSPFKPGMTASVEIITNKKDHVLSVPLAAVTTRKPENKDQSDQKDAKEQEDNRKQAGPAEGPEQKNNQPAANQPDELKEVVFINVNGIATMVEVETGISDYERIEIVKGLEPGQQVISGPYLAVSKRLKEGDKLKAQEDSGKQD